MRCREVVRNLDIETFVCRSFLWFFHIVWDAVPRFFFQKGQLSSGCLARLVVQPSPKPLPWLWQARLSPKRDSRFSGPGCLYWGGAFWGVIQIGDWWAVLRDWSWAKGGEGLRCLGKMLISLVGHWSNDSGILNMFNGQQWGSLQHWRRGIPRVLEEGIMRELVEGNCLTSGYCNYGLEADYYSGVQTSPRVL